MGQGHSEGGCGTQGEIMAPLWDLQQTAFILSSLFLSQQLGHYNVCDLPRHNHNGLLILHRVCVTSFKGDGFQTRTCRPTKSHNSCSHILIQLGIPLVHGPFHELPSIEPFS